MLLRLASFLILSTSSQNCTITVPNIVSIVFSSSVVLTMCPIWVISRMKNCLRCSIWTLSFPATILSLTSRSTMLECELHNVAIHDMRTCHFVSPCHIRYSLASIAFSVVLQVREAGWKKNVYVLDFMSRAFNSELLFIDACLCTPTHICQHIQYK